MAYANDDYRRHGIVILDSFKDSLIIHEKNIESIKLSYKDKLGAARAGGLMSQYTEQLGGDKFRAFEGHLQRLYEVIEHTKSVIDWQKAQIEEQIRLAEELARNTN